MGCGFATIAQEIGHGGFVETEVKCSTAHMPVCERVSAQGEGTEARLQDRRKSTSP